MNRLEAKIFGDVQGVFFRAFIKRQAKQRNIVGTVQNLDDGSVELIAEGLKGDLDELLALLATGPQICQG